MAIPVKAFKAAEFIIQFETAPGNGIFVPKCMINTERGLAFSSSETVTPIPYCDIPDAPSWVERDIDALSIVISGAGIANTPDRGFFFDWWTSGIEKNIRALIDVAAVDGGGYWAGAAKISAFDLTGPENKARVTFTCTIGNHGPWTWTDAT